MADNKFVVLKRILKTFGLSEEKIDELIGWIRTWLLDEDEKKTGETKYPYRLRDDFLSPAEQNFMRVLRTCTADWAMIAPKVSLGDLFYAQTGDFSQNRVYRNKIDRKHVDFLLYDPKTLLPILGVELDDKSHKRKDRQARDRFVDRVFKAAGLPIAHVSVRYSYQVADLNNYLKTEAGISFAEDEPEEQGAEDHEAASDELACPKCGSAMILRTAKRGPNKGNQFRGCTDYPQCRGIVSVTP